MSTDYVCSHITSVSDLAQIEGGWRDLQERHPPLTPFASYEWMSTWYKHIPWHARRDVVGRGDDRFHSIHVVVARHDGRVVAVAPMIRTERGGLQSATAGDYWEMVLDPEHPMAVRALLAAMLRETAPGRQIDSLLVPRDNATYARVRHECGQAGVPLYITNGPDMALTDCSGSVEAYAAERRRLFKDMRYHHRRLERLGTLEHRVERDGDLDAHLERFIALEGMAWKAGAGSAISSHRHRVRFWKDVAKALAASRRLAIHFLTLDGKAIAVRCTIEWGDTVYALRIGYDPAYSKYSPGNVLVWLFTRTVFSSPELRCIDYGYADVGAWKKRWVTSVRRCAGLHIFPPTLRGVWNGFVSYRLKRHLKRCKALVRVVRRARSWRPSSAPGTREQSGSPQAGER